ncbi:MAG TPA: hypothetical protein VK518_25680 [Puia sp.]|jgi:hypothetical protein|nr:hypothetical protein [Puia sp.]
MKALFTFLALPVIILICFLSSQFYISGEYVIAYTLVATSFASLIGWINQVGLQLQRQRA